MGEEKKYLRRLDIGLVIEIELVLLQFLQPFLDQAGISYEVLDAPPEEEEGGNQRRRRSS
jgi:hypothetical protein